MGEIPKLRAKFDDDLSLTSDPLTSYRTSNFSHSYLSPSTSACSDSLSLVHVYSIDFDFAVVDRVSLRNSAVMHWRLDVADIVGTLTAALDH